MRIGIDLRFVQTILKVSGIGTYTKNLIENIARIDSKNEYVFFYFPDEAILDWDIKYPHFKYENFFVVNRPKILKKHPWIIEQILLPIDSIRSKVDVIFSPDTFHWQPKKFIITIHDLIYLVFKDEYYLGKSWWWQYQIRLWTAKRAEKIITDSESSKRDIIKFLKISDDKIKVIYPGVKIPTYSKSNIKNRKLEIGKYFLYVGRFSRRKNVRQLIEIFSDINKELAGEYKLVLAGGSEAEINEFSKLIDEKKLNNNVVLFGVVSDDELSSLYEFAEIFLFPSLYEGFGLPLLESMAHKVPVISYNVSSMPEVVGNAGILVNTKDEFKNKVIELVRNENIRNEYKERGFERAKLFSWEKTAEEFLFIINSLNHKS